MNHALVAFSCCTGLICVNSGNYQYLILYLLLNGNEPWNIVKDRLFLVSRARSYYKQELVALAREHIGYFLVTLFLGFHYLFRQRVQLLYFLWCRELSYHVHTHCFSFLSFLTLYTSHPEFLWVPYNQKPPSDHLWPEGGYIYPRYHLNSPYRCKHWYTVFKAVTGLPGWLTGSALSAHLSGMNSGFIFCRLAPYPTLCEKSAALLFSICDLWCIFGLNPVSAGIM